MQKTNTVGEHIEDVTDTHVSKTQYKWGIRFNFMNLTPMLCAIN